MKYTLVPNTMRDGSSSVAEEAKAALLADNTLFIADSDLNVAPQVLRGHAEQFATNNQKVLKHRRETLDGKAGFVLWLEDPS